MFDRSVTFIVPVFKLQEHRIKNLKFILPHLIGTGKRVLVVEQIDGIFSDLSPILKDFGGVEHLLYQSDSKEFHKTGIINWAVATHVKTKYAWVNDVDFYMKFSDAISTEWTEYFIQPYSVGKKLSENDTNSILTGHSLDIDFGDQTA